MSEQLDLMGGYNRVVGARPDDDFYCSPAWLARLLVKYAVGCASDRRTSVMDLGVGTGSLLRAAEHALPLACCYGVELDEARCRSLPKRWSVWCGDVTEVNGTFDIVLSNPPFKDWQEWADLGKRLVWSVEAVPGVLPPAGGVLAMIGFASLLGGQKRAAWWRADPPTKVVLVSRRPSYTPDGATDPRDTILVLWDGNELKGPTQFCWATPEECR